MQNCSSYIMEKKFHTETFFTLESQEKVEPKFTKAIKQLYIIDIFKFLSSYFLKAFNFQYRVTITKKSSVVELT